MSFISAIKGFFKGKIVVTFHLKSGERIVVKMDNITIKNNANELVSVKYEGLKGNGSLFYIRLDDISAITYK